MFQTIITFGSGVVVGAYIAQQYKVPDIRTEFYKLKGFIESKMKDYEKISEPEKPKSQ